MTYKLKKEGLTESIRYCFLAFMCFTLAFLVLLFPQKAGSGVTDAVELCLHTVIPSLFPFIFISSLFVTSNLYLKISKPFEKITGLFFRLSGESAGIIMMSLIGGYPVGAQMISSVYENGSIGKNQSQRLSLFCVNAGPSFVIGTVGCYMLGSRIAGVYVYISLVLSSLLMGFLTRFIDDGKEKDTVILPVIHPEQINKAVCLAAQKSPFSMLNVCVWIVLFNCFIRISGLENPSFPSGEAIVSLLEVTSGCKAACGAYSLPIIAGIIGWGGVCVHCQIMPYLIKYGTDLRLFFASRVLNGAFATLICHGLITLFPLRTAAFSNIDSSAAVSLTNSIPVSAGLLVMCALLLLGENFSVQKSKKS